jgi:hypothetical protein
MRRLNNFFLESFGVPIAQIIPLPNEELFCLTKNGLLYGSASAKDKPFIKSNDKGYFLIGYWGHGINSYAFYYSRIDEWSHILFRLAYGGIYSNEAEDARRVRKFLSNYFEFEPELKTKTQSLIAIDSMGDGNYTITMHDGKLVSLRESLFHNADFKEKFSHLIQD